MKLTIKTPEVVLRPDVFIFNFEQMSMSNIVLMFLLVTLNKKMPAFRRLDKFSSNILCLINFSK